MGNMVQDKVVVVTGAGGGIGRAIALALAAEGAKVVVNDIGTGLQGEGLSDGPAQAVVQEIRAAGGQAIASTESVAEEASAQRTIAMAVEHFGRIDGVVNNAGILRDRMFHAMSAEEFDAMLQSRHDELGKFLIAFDERYRGPYARSIFKLSPQEVRVLAFLAGGMAVARLSHEMGLSAKTVEAYMASARRKTTSATTAEAVAKAIFFGLV